MVVTAMGWNGTDVAFQEFSSESRCREAAGSLSEMIKKYGGGKSWSVRCMPK